MTNINMISVLMDFDLDPKKNRRKKHQLIFPMCEIGWSEHYKYIAAWRFQQYFEHCQRWKWDDAPQ